MLPTQKYRDLSEKDVKEYRIPKRLQNRIARSKKEQHAFTGSHIGHTDYSDIGHSDYYVDRG